MAKPDGDRSSQHIACERFLRVLSLVSASACLSILLWQAWACAPTADERHQLAASVAIARTGDFGHYRVNPPIHKLISGLPVEILVRPKLTGLHIPSSLRSGNRLEVKLGDRFLRDNLSQLPLIFFLARLPRILIVVAAGFVLLRWPVGLPPTARYTTAILWFTSPWILGHGWLVMPDGMSAVAALILVLALTHWLSVKDFYARCFVGVAWGIAIGTKFTFAVPLLFWMLLVSIRTTMQLGVSKRAATELAKDVLLPCVIALFLVNLVYGVQQTGTPLGQHEFGSRLFSTFAAGWAADLPSPFPKQFLVGVDEQLLDLERGFPTYVNGKWLHGNTWWWYGVAYICKEQVAALAALLGIFLCVVFCRKKWLGNLHDTSLTVVVISVSGILSIAFALGLGNQMAANGRYIMPMLPCIYLLIGVHAAILIGANARKGLPAIAVFVAVIAFEVARTTPHWFSYINPLVGGSYATPPVLHAANFDGGQDARRLQAHLDRMDSSSVVYVCAHGSIPLDQVVSGFRVPSSEVLKSVLQDTRGDGYSGEDGVAVSLVIMRGLCMREPWTEMIGARLTPKSKRILDDFNRVPPDDFLTPTIAIYHAVIPPHSGLMN